MPVTARLSKLFYERLGEEVANELVDWFNAVDATYRADLRALNDLNFARFDAKLEQRVAQLEAKLEQRLAQVEAKLEQRLAQVEAKLEQQVAEVEAKLEQRLAQVEARMDRKLAELEAKLERRLAEQTRWLVAAWAALLIPIIGLWFRG